MLERIAIVCDAYPPMRTSGAVQIADLAREFCRQNHSVCMIVPSSNLSSPWKLDHDDAVDVLRVRCPETKDVSYFVRAIRELWLPLGMLVGIFRSPVRLSEFSAVVWYSPTIFFGPLIAVLKRASRCRSYLILRDIFPDWALNAGILKHGPAYWWFKAVERYQYYVADTIGVQSEKNLEYFSGSRAATKRRVEVLHNWLAEFEESATSTIPFVQIFDGKVVFAYIGNMGVAQDPIRLVYLAQRMRDCSNVIFLFVGRGSQLEEMQGYVDRERVGNVMFFNEIEHREVGNLLKLCHVGLVTLDSRHETHNIPGKFLAYLRAGLPVLARVNDGNDLIEMIRESEVGFVSAGNDSEELLEAHARTLASDAGLRSRYGKNGLVLARTQFSPDRAVKTISSALGLSPTV
jgi:glycosyltransferase involved in cell wall biosynthesis